MSLTKKKEKNGLQKINFLYLITLGPGLSKEKKHKKTKKKKPLR